MDQIVFKRWSNRKWAILASFHKIIVIGILCYSYNILGQDLPAGQIDSSKIMIYLELEEVEALADSPFELENVSQKPLITINSHEINSSPVIAPEDLMEYLPQVDIRQRGKFGTQADLNIQGGSFDQSLVLLNGINLSDPQTGHFHLNLPVDLSAIHHLELNTGSSARRYGTHAFSGAVNFITRPYDSTSFSSGFRYGQHNFYKAYLNANVSGKFVSTMTSISTSGSNGYRENTDFNSTHIYFHSATRPGKFNVQLMMGLNTREFGANAFYSPRFIHQYEETTTGMTGVKMVLKRSRSAYTFNAYFRFNKDYFLLDRYDPDFYRNDHLTQVTGAELNGRFSSRAGITLSGLQFRREGIQSTSLGKPLKSAISHSKKDDIIFDHGHTRNLFNWNINHSLEIRWFSLDAGFMLHMNSDMGFKPFLFPGIDLKFQIPQSMQVYASWNYSMRLPTFTDLYYQGPTNMGNPDLLPERATTFELGISRKGEILYTELNGFFRQGRDLIDWIWMEDELWHTMNLTEVDALGSAFRIEYTPSNTRYHPIYVEKMNLSYTFTHLTKISDEVISRYLLDNLRHKMALLTNLGITQNLLLSVRFTIQDRNGSYLKYDPESGQSAEQYYEPFLLVDTKLTYSIKRYHIFLETTNLLNVTYHDIGNVIQPGRWIIAGFEIR